MPILTKKIKPIPRVIPKPSDTPYVHPIPNEPAGLRRPEKEKALDRSYDLIREDLKDMQDDIIKKQQRAMRAQGRRANLQEAATRAWDLRADSNESATSARQKKTASKYPGVK